MTQFFRTDLWTGDLKCSLLKADLDAYFRVGVNIKLQENDTVTKTMADAFTLCSLTDEAAGVGEI